MGSVNISLGSCWVWGCVFICSLTRYCQLALLMVSSLGKCLLSTYYVSSPDVIAELEEPSLLKSEAEEKGKEPEEVEVSNYQESVETPRKSFPMVYSVLLRDKWWVEEGNSFPASSLWDAVMRVWDWQSAGGGPGSASNSLCDLGQVPYPLWSQFALQYVGQGREARWSLNLFLLPTVGRSGLKESMYHVRCTQSLDFFPLQHGPANICWPLSQSCQDYSRSEVFNPRAADQYRSVAC